MDKESRLLSFKKRVKVTDEALREHYRLITEKKRVPCDYLVMFTEGGEADAIALANSKAQDTQSVKAILKWMEEHECFPEEHDAIYEGIDKIEKHHPDCELCFWEALKRSI